MPSSIFSTYSTGENRVTASIMAVLKSLSLNRIERLLGAMMEQSEFELVRFQNQPAKGAKSVPDAEILSNCRILIETKVRRNTVRVDQLQHHLSQLNGAQESRRVLLVITPDQAQPKAFDKLNDPDGRTAWTSFAALDQAIDELLADRNDVVSEREAFLLRELQKMLAEEGLIGSESDVLVVAARHAWPEYERCHAYVCQPGRTFRPVQYIAFYSKGNIFPRVPRIEEIHDEVILKRKQHKGRLGKVVEHLIDDIPRSKKVVSQRHKFLLLSSPDAIETIKLERAIVNDLLDKDGKPIAFTMGQRYVSLEKLRKASTTSDLV